MVNALNYINQIFEYVDNANLSDWFHAAVIILAQTLGLWVGYLFTEWVRGTDPDEDIDNELEK